MLNIFVYSAKFVNDSIVDIHVIVVRYAHALLGKPQKMLTFFLVAGPPRRGNTLRTHEVITFPTAVDLKKNVLNKPLQTYF